MEEFLATSKKHLANLESCERVRVVLGNPTCDLDSAACALAHGFLEYQEHKDVAVVPVLNVTRDEFRLKTEVVYLLKRLNVPRDLLTFRDEIDLARLHSLGKLELALVDHHALSTEDSALAPAVYEVIDHRPHDAAWPWTGRKLTLGRVGSCATLVARDALGRNPEALVHLCQLLRGAILIDTANFSEEADRATPLDHEMIARLDEICGGDSTTRSQLYRDLLAAKTDISELTPGDLLTRDLKVVNGVPIAGFPILVEEFVELAGAAEALEAFCRGRACQLAVLMGLRLDDDDRPTRDIAVCHLGAEDAPANNLIEALTSCTSPALQLTEARRHELGPVKLLLYRQGNARASRKQILPIVQAATA